MKLLLTGATGFIGRTLMLRALKESRYEKIYVVVRSAKKLEAQFQEDGISEIPSVVEVLNAEAPQWTGAEFPEVDHVIHCAGSLFANSADEFLEINVEGTKHLLKKLKGAPRVVVLSSQAATGPTPEGKDKRSENDAAAPVTWYGKSKLQMEKMLAAEFSSVNYVCLRPPMVLGPRDTATLPLFKLAKRKLTFKPGFKPRTYSYISANDLVEAIFVALAGTSKQREYFITAPEPIEDKNLIQKVAQSMGRSRRLVAPVPEFIIGGVSVIVEAVAPFRKLVPTLSRDRVQELWPTKWVVSSEAFERDYGWKAKEPLEDTLRAAAQWYKLV